MVSVGSTPPNVLDCPKPVALFTKNLTIKNCRKCKTKIKKSFTKILTIILSVKFVLTLRVILPCLSVKFVLTLRVILPCLSVKFCLVFYRK